MSSPISRQTIQQFLGSLRTRTLRPLHAGAVRPVEYSSAANRTDTSVHVAEGAKAMVDKNPSIPWSTKNEPDNPKKKQAPASPSPSASVILISPTNKILLLHRVQTSSSFPSAHVFPGGNLEASDGHIPTGDANPERHRDSPAYRTGALRELFEESNVLLARENATPSSELITLPRNLRLQGRNDIHSGKTTIQAWLSSHAPSAVLDVDALIPFTRWITPTNVPKRFTTQMYLYFVPTSARRNGSLIATGDEVETMAPEWRYAKEWVAAARTGEIILFPPQFMLLSFVSQFLDGEVKGSEMSEQEVEARRDRLRDFVITDGSPPWRDKVISPTALSFTRQDGRSVLGLDKPGPELKDAHGVRGDDTRVVLVKFSKEGPRDVEVRDRKETMAEMRREEQAARSKI